MSDEAYHAFVSGRLLGMRNNRYSWWTHWREVADYFLPRRYRWLITANQWNRGSPINQHIIDSTGVTCARNLASGMMSGKTSPSRPWFKLKIGRLDSTQTSPMSLWLAECERLMRLVFHESNFYNSIATFYYDLVIFGTAVILIYEDYENVINCYNPCAGEYYIDIDGRYRPVIFYREFTMTIGAVVDEFGYENCTHDIREAFDQRDGSGRTREVIIAHAIEPNTDGKRFGIPPRFAYREVYWVWGGSTSPQGKGYTSPCFLRKRGYFEQCAIVCRWDLVSNDPYGRSPAMDALGDQKQLQQESRRKGQAIDKMVNPPLVADAQLKNHPASLLPGGITYLAGYAQTGKGMASVYDTKFPIGDIKEDMDEVRDRLKKTFFNDLFQPLSQYETRSNITITEVDQRKAESLIMLGPVFERVDDEGLGPIVDRVFNIMARAGIFPPPPPEIAGLAMDIEFVSMLNSAQQAAEAASIERSLSLAGNLAGVTPAVLDTIDFDFAMTKYSNLLQIDPRMIRAPEALAQLREERAQQQQMAQQAEMAEKMAAGAKNLAAADVSQPNALTALMGGGGGAV
jgi:hypothetical protein